MKIRFWGVRGSYPTPLTPEKLRGKISAVVQRIKPEDLKNSESRELFLSRLPEWLFGTPGGNTPCVECETDGSGCMIFDAGTGIAELSKSLGKEGRNPGEFHLFISHFHYDHLQGLPFFGQAYNPSVKMNFYSPDNEIEQKLKQHMQHPYFPVTMEDRMTPGQFYHTLPESGVSIGDAGISWYRLNHPGNAYAYKVTHEGKSFVYATDVELQEKDFPEFAGKENFFRNVDVLVMDTMYTLGEAIDKYNWGHSSFSLGVEFAIKWGIKTLVLFHHEPKYEDRQLYTNLHTAQWYAQRQKSTIKILLAEEGMELDI